MASIHELLELPVDAPAAEVEETYNHRLEHWIQLQSLHPERKDEAQSEISRLEDAMGLYQKSDHTAGLEVRDEVRAAGGTAAATINKDACPHCEYRDNPPGTRYCLQCNNQLFQVCPNPVCRKELPWHYKSCPHCGTNIDQFHEATKRKEQDERAQVLEGKRRELAQIQSDLQMVESPSLTGYFWWSGSHARVRQLSGRSLYGCTNLFIEFGVFLGVLVVIPAILSAITSNQILILVLTLVSLFFAIRLPYKLSFQKPALDNLRNQEVQLRQEIARLQEGG